MDIITNRLLRQAVPLFSAMAGVALVLGIATILIVGKDVIVHVALALLLSFALTPIVVWLERRGLAHGLSVFFAILLALSFIVGIGYVTYRQVVALAQQVPSYEPTMQQKISSLSQQMAQPGVFGNAADALERVLANLQKIGDTETATRQAAQTVRVDDQAHGLIALYQYLEPALLPVGSLLVVLLLTTFMLAEREDLRNRIFRLAGTEDIQQTTAAFDDAGFRVGRLLLMQLILNMTLGLIISLGLWLIGLPSPFLWGILAGIFHFVPYIGVFVSMAAPLFVAFAIDPGWTVLLWTLALFLITDTTFSNVLEPFLYGRSSGLAPLSIVIAEMIWTFLWGPIGLVLSTPLTICVVVIGRHIKRLQFLEVLLSDRPALEPHEIFYQRMLANDPREAEVQAREFLKGRGLSTYYDEIALEAIRRAHLDIVRASVTGERLATLVASSETLVDSLDDVQPLARGRDHNLTAEAEAALDTVRPEREAEKVVLARDDLGENWRGDYPIAILHGAHPLDGAAAKMLQQVFTKHGLPARALPLAEAARATPEDAKAVALVCLSFIEPLSTLHLRAFSRQVKRHAPQAQVMLCIWQKTDDALIKEWRRKLRVDRLVTTTADALDAAASIATAK
ncbi:MAG: AI-2E family transporter [Candidatus Competibacteraceae bacterium]|nr:AI-2E family transporter [Candidatus Competibacteraceae bacterium]